MAKFVISNEPNKQIDENVPINFNAYQALESI